MKHSNPFLTKGYISPEYFCDRKQELERLRNAVDNNRNLTLISLRRMGKTGLIHHMFHYLEKEKGLLPIYIDLYHTENINQFINHFGNICIQKLEGSFDRSIKLVTSLLKSIKPTISYNDVTGQPEIDFNASTDAEIRYSLDQLFQLIKKEQRKVIIAFDEFQQITNYPKKNTEAILRSYIQQNPQTEFIFSGSAQSLLIQMFTDHARPFYQSTEIMQINEIAPEPYISFISGHFKKNKIEITDEAISRILNLCYSHTYYVQYFCNKLYSSGCQKINELQVNQMLLDIISENQPVYHTYKQILPPKQLSLLTALANEGITHQPSSGQFINKYRLGTSSTVSFSLKSLIEKDLVHKNEVGYRVSDVFLLHWLRL